MDLGDFRKINGFCTRYYSATVRYSVLLFHMERSYSGGVQRRVIFDSQPKMDNFRHFEHRLFSVCNVKSVRHALCAMFCTRYISESTERILLCYCIWKDHTVEVCNEGLFLILSQKWTILDTLNIGDFLYMSSLYVTLYVLCFVRARSRNQLNGFGSAIAYVKTI